MYIHVYVLVYVEDNLQKVDEEIAFFRKPLLEEQHHPGQDDGDLSQRGYRVQRHLVARAHPLFHYLCQRLQHFGVLCMHE